MLYKQLIKDGYHVVGIEQADKSTKLNEFELPKKPIAIIMGNEVNGVDQQAIDLCNEVIEIPQFGTKHSLNIAVTSGIVIWDLWKKLILNYNQSIFPKYKLYQKKSL